MIVTDGLTEHDGRSRAVDVLGFPVAPGGVGLTAVADRRGGKSPLDMPEFIFGNPVSAVVAQHTGDLSVTIGTVLMVTSCAAALMLGAAVLDRRDA
jgi:hypothetical protein